MQMDILRSMANMSLQLLLLSPLITTQIPELLCSFSQLDLRDDLHHGALLWDPQQPSVLRVQLMENNGPHQPMMALFYFVLLQ